MTKCSQERKNITLESLDERMRGAGIKVTQQRRQLLKVLLEHPEPISADEIFKKFEDSDERMDLVTIYRIFKKFEETALVSRLEFGDGIARFEMLLESGHHHHHVICRKCQRVEALHLCDLGPHLKAVEAMGYTQLSHRLDFFGICSKCRTSRK